MLDKSFGQYVSIMNESVSKKQFLLRYFKGQSLLDVGCGGGEFLKVAQNEYPDKHFVGVDISVDMIRETMKNVPGSQAFLMNVLDAQPLSALMHDQNIDTVSFCSVLHEIFSYDCDNTRKFNILRVIRALENVFTHLPIGGRILIRDGIRSYNGNELRMIKFSDANFQLLAEYYLREFKGRQIEYNTIGNKFILKLDDAMELLYTITWGEESFAREIQEQFGYFTPDQFCRRVQEFLGPQADVLFSQSFLQDGYEQHILPKATLWDAEGACQMPLPHSTFIMVIQKK